MKKDRKRRVDAVHGEVGKCPFCNSADYRRQPHGVESDALIYKCFCECGKTFDETFYLMFQDWTE